MVHMDDISDIVSVRSAQIDDVARNHTMIFDVYMQHIRGGAHVKLHDVDRCHSGARRSGRPRGKSATTAIHGMYTALFDRSH